MVKQIIPDEDSPAGRGESWADTPGELQTLAELGAVPGIGFDEQRKTCCPRSLGTVRVGGVRDAGKQDGASSSGNGSDRSWSNDRSYHVC